MRKGGSRREANKRGDLISRNRGGGEEQGPLGRDGFPYFFSGGGCVRGGEGGLIASNCNQQQTSDASDRLSKKLLLRGAKSLSKNNQPFRTPLDFSFFFFPFFFCYNGNRCWRL